MPTTGVTLLNELQLRGGQAYSGVIDASDGDRYFKWGLIRLFAARFKGLAGTEYLDEMRNFTISDYQITPDNNNKVYLDGLTAPFIPNYLHLLNIRLKFYIPLNLTITNATNTNPIIITVKERNNMRSTNYGAVTPAQYVIAGIAGNTAANGIFYGKKLGDFKLALYSDVLLQTPVAGNGTYLPFASTGANIQRVYNFPAEPYLTVEKGGQIPSATPQNPNYQVAQGSIICYPLTFQCQGMTIDYLKNNLPYPDCTDNIFDYNTIFTNKFIDDWISEAALIYSEEIRDVGLEQSSVTDIRQNP
jgi:hypothetical protein